MFEAHKKRILAILAAAAILIVGVVAEVATGFLGMFTDETTIEQVETEVEVSE